MSATVQEREANWAEWLKRNQIPGVKLVGFIHWCGSATIIYDWENLDGPYCAGCRCCVDGRRGDDESTPLYVAWPVGEASE